MSARAWSAAARLSVAAALLAVAGRAAAGDDDRLYPVLKDGRWGYIDASGHVVIPPAFDRAGPFSEGLAAVQQGQVHGYVDRTGKMALVPAYAPAGTIHRRFSSGRAAVKKDHRVGYIDRTGALVIPARYLLGEDFSEDHAVVCAERSVGCGYVDVHGTGVIGPGLMGGYPVRGGLACKILMMSMSRQLVALQPVGGPPLAGEYAGCGRPAEGLVAVRVGDAWGYVDLQGKPVVKPAFAWAGEFSGGLAPARDATGRCGYVDRSGAFVVPPRWRTCDPFAGALARVDVAEHAADAEHWVFVDRAGKVVIDGRVMDPPFDSAEPFDGALAPVGQGGEPHLAAADGPLLGYVNASGRWVWRPAH
jgi:hypothetical protein